MSGQNAEANEKIAKTVPTAKHKNILKGF